MANKLKVAAVQISSGKDTKHNLERAFETAKLAKENGAKIICFPELFTLPWFAGSIDKTPFKYAQTLSGNIITDARKQAKAWKVCLIIPFFEDSEKGSYYNSAAVIGPDGEVIGVYRKVHVPQVRLRLSQHLFLLVF